MTEFLRVVAAKYLCWNKLATDLPPLSPAMLVSSLIADKDRPGPAGYLLAQARAEWSDPRPGYVTFLCPGGTETLQMHRSFLFATAFALVTSAATAHVLFETAQAPVGSTTRQS
jgi:hypothetical protein